MADFFSPRFGKQVWITDHARKSMQKRGVLLETLEKIIENGEIKQKNNLDMWVYMCIPDRADNLICVAAINSTAIIVKTVMINWELENKYEN
jgi:hypothetical protein